MLDPQREYRTMEWPYASVRRGRLPADEVALGAAEYNMIDRPYGTAAAVREVPQAAVVLWQHVHAQLARRRESASDDRHPLRVGARARARRQDEPLGTRLAADVGLRLQGREPRRIRRRLADLATRICRRTTTRWTPLLGISGTQREHAAAARQHVSARAEVQLRREDAQDGDRADGAASDPRTRRRDDRGRRQQVPAAAAWAAAAADAAAICSAPMHSPTALIFPARDTGNLTVRPNSMVSEVLLDPRTNGVRRARDRQRHARGVRLHARAS